MSEPLSSDPVILDRPENLCYWFPGHSTEFPGQWDIAISSIPGADELHWSFRLLSDEEPFRGYRDSIRQRALLWERLSNRTVIRTCFEGSNFARLTAPFIEGEPLPAYCERVRIPASGPLFCLLIDLVRALAELAEGTRFLSCVVEEDFFVSRRSGVRLVASLCPTPAIVRKESPKSDFEIGRYWVGVIAALIASAQDRWKKSPAVYDPRGCRILRPLLKEIDSGKEKSLRECLTEVEEILRAELASDRVQREKHRLIRDAALVPRGALAEVLGSSFESGKPKLIPGSLFSVEQENRGAFLLPPEGWMEGSLISAVNRRMSSPYLKSHPNLVRIRSVSCDERATVLSCAEPAGIPLPSLLEVSQGLKENEIRSIAIKASRALSLFESAEFSLDLVSPWQVELHSVCPDKAKTFRIEANSDSMENWPAWDVKFRVERPAESFILEQSPESWTEVKGRVVRKSFPALVIWMLEYRRIEECLHQGLRTFPLSEDHGLNALFESIAEFYDESNPSHRTRFLELMDEALGFT